MPASRWTVALVMTLACVLGASAQQPAADFDFAAVGRMPVRFNGRLTTWDAVAVNAMRQVSGRDDYTDLAGVRQPAVRWMLDAALQMPSMDKPQLVPIDDEKLIATLELPARPSKRYAIGELLAKSNQIEVAARLCAQTPPEKLTAADKAVLTLAWRLQSPQRIAMAFYMGNDNTAEGVMAALRRAAANESVGLAMIVPPTAADARWRTFARAGLEHLGANLLEARQPAISVIEPLVKVFSAYQDNKPADFNRAVAEYAAVVEKLNLPKGPWDHTLPQGWIEVGMPEQPAQHYGDVRASGHPVAEYVIIEDGRRATVRVHHFATRIGKPADAMNSWRIGQGLAPLPAAKAEKTIKTLHIGERDLSLFEIVTPADLGRPIDRLCATIVNAEGAAAPHTFEISLYGDPVLVERHREKFREFVASWKLGTADELSAWFPLSKEPAAPLPARMLALVMPAGKDRLRVVQLVGSPEQVAPHEKAFYAFTRSIRLKADGGQPAWTLPEGWQEVTNVGKPFIGVGAGTAQQLAVDVDLLAEAEDESLLELVNAWRAMFAKPPIDAAMLAKETTAIAVEGGAMTLVDLSSAPPAPAKPLAYVVPPQWEEVPPTPMRQASFRIGKGELTSDVLVMRLPAAGSLVDNVNRWRQQLKLPVQSPEQVRAACKPVKVSGHDGHRVDLRSEDAKPQRTIAVMVTRGNESWFVKLSGPAEVVDGQVEAFDAFLKSIQFRAE